MSKLTFTQREARIIAIEEAAEHLELDWTDNAEERKQAKIVSGLLRKWAERLNRAAPPRGPKESE